MGRQRVAWVYAINTADAIQGLGPLFGRYPGDTYDGDNSDSSSGHPWALCTCNVAELYCGLANEIAGGKPVPFDDLSAPFFSQIGVDVHHLAGRRRDRAARRGRRDAPGGRLPQ